MSNMGLSKLRPFLDMPYEVLDGSLPNYSLNSKFGANPTLGTTEEEIWDVGGIMTYLSSAETMDISSSSSSDDDGSTGAEELIIFGIDGSYNEQQENIILDGMNTVVTSNSYLRVNRMRVIRAGNNGSNVGTITCVSSSTAATQARIPIGFNQTTKTQFTIPADQTLVLTDFTAGTERNEECEFRIYVRPFGQVFQLRDFFKVFEGDISLSFQGPLVFDGRSDISVRGINTGSGTITTTVSYKFYLINTG